MDLEHKAIERLRMAAEMSEKYYQKPLLVTVSGGKDSEVCLELCRRARIPFEVVHNLTTADAPETVRHVRKTFRRLELAGVPCAILSPLYKGNPTSMWKLIPQKLIPPTRKIRWCCAYLKEVANPHRCIALGVRSAESISRADSGVLELPGKTRREKITFDMDNGDSRVIAVCQAKAKLKVHPIVDWTDRDVWAFLHDAGIEVNPCYSMGLRRVGCIGCPMASKSRYTEFQLWPKYEQLYRRAFVRMLEGRIATGKDRLWQTADEVFRWWMEDKNLEGQLDIWGGEIGGYKHL